MRESLCRSWQTLTLLEEAPIVWLIFFYVSMTEGNLDDILLRLYETHQPHDILSGVLRAYCKEALDHAKQFEPNWPGRIPIAVFDLVLSEAGPPRRVREVGQTCDGEVLIPKALLRVPSRGLQRQEKCKNTANRYRSY